MEIIFKIICPILLLTSICFSFYQKDQYNTLTKELNYKLDRQNSENTRLESRVKILTAREQNLLETTMEQKKEIETIFADLEKSNTELGNAKELFQKREEEIENSKKLVARAEKRVKAAEEALATIQAENAKTAEVKEVKVFKVTQDVYLKRFQNIVNRLNSNIALARAKDPDRGKRGNANGMGSLASESSLAHIRAAEKAQKELEAMNLPSQKFYVAITAEKQRWANEKSRWEYLPQCSSQLQKDTAQFLSQTPTYLDE